MPEFDPQAAREKLEAWSGEQPAVFGKAEIATLVEALEEAQAAGRKAQDKWEEWIESELAGTSLFGPAIEEAKETRAILRESE